MAKNNFILLEELVITIDKIGYDKTLEIIRSSRKIATDSDSIVQEYIIQQVCHSYNISKKELIEGTSSGDRTNAIAILCYLIKKHLGLSQNRISFIVKKDDSVVSKYLKKIYFLDKNHQEDKKILDRINIIDSIIIEFKHNILN